MVDLLNIMASATSSRFKDWWTSRKMNFTKDNHTVISSSDVVFISVKPHLYLDMLDTLKEEGRKYKDKLWFSIMAGVVL
jgi:pyrroline-5-carboxylate reductase